MKNYQKRLEEVYAFANRIKDDIAERYLGNPAADGPEFEPDMDDDLVRIAAIGLACQVMYLAVEEYAKEKASGKKVEEMLKEMKSEWN